jgi:hypothetical protein
VSVLTGAVLHARASDALIGHVAWRLRASDSFPVQPQRDSGSNLALGAGSYVVVSSPGRRRGGGCREHGFDDFIGKPPQRGIRRYWAEDDV